MRKARLRFSGRALGAMLIGIALACSTFSVAGAANSVTVGAKDFAGAQIISQAYGQYLSSKGYDISYKDKIGPTEITFPALKSGDIGAYGDYQGTLLTYLGGTPTGSMSETYKLLKAKLKGTGITALPPATAVDVNAFYVLKSTAKKYKLKKVSDLKKVAPKLTFGGPAECVDRPLCLGTTSQQLYKLDFKDVRKLDAGGPITNKALDDGTIQVGLLFTGSSVIKKNYVLLADDKGLQPSDNAIFVVKSSIATSKLKKDAAKVTAALTTAAYNKAALSVFNDKIDPATAATTLLKDAKLIK